MKLTTTPPLPINSVKQHEHSYTVLINRESGLTNRLGEDSLHDSLKGMNVPFNTIHFVTMDGMISILHDTKSSLEYLLIGGGDGTVRTCAQSVLNTGKTFGILPMGTMNFLARDLGIPANFEDAALAYGRGFKRKRIDVAIVNGEAFLCCFGLGTMPEASIYREERRAQGDPFLMLLPRLVFFTFNRMDRTQRRLINLTLDKQKKSIKTSALVVSNNLFTPDTNDGGNILHRNSLDKGKFGIYSVAPSHILEKMRLLWLIKFGNWHSDSLVKKWKSESFSINTHRETELISLDGEPMEMRPPFNFSMHHEGLDILVPA